MEGSEIIMAKRGELTPIEKEFADFVNTHDTAEMIEKGELFEVSDVKITIPTRKTAITMKIYPALLNRIKRIAEIQQMPYQSLINQWLAERTYFEEHKEELVT
jgi:predicted DNA binding CopG/RHH family protein